MALRYPMLRSRGGGSPKFLLQRWAHSVARPPLFDALIAPPPVSSPHCVLPEFDRSPEESEIGFPSFGTGGTSELMGSVRSKTTPHRKGLRNGPKALKPVPVIIRCRGCGRVKLPHFFCCSGEKGKPTEKNGVN